MIDSLYLLSVIWTFKGVTSRNSVLLQQKKEVSFNDKTGSCISLTLWNDFVGLKSGVYVIYNVQLRKYPNTDHPTLTSISTSIFKSHDKKIKPASPTMKLYRTLKFPIQNVIVSSRQLKCMKCDNYAGTVQPNCNFKKCESCGISTRYSNLAV